ncbi:Hypothetical predicted protein [Cloeon dipterum]|uniref:Methyltransferase FkbM domain-containing protein n=1 Tax=Cloeon dipterum TaxID=197152 RepID=A0A8S1BXB7_9INSE|nr:Hypothetical predicted protein [Cloeon dipterum]
MKAKFTAMNSYQLQAMTCVFFVIAITWHIFQSNKELTQLRKVVFEQEKELVKLRESHDSMKWSMDSLWVDVNREAANLVQTEDDVYLQNLVNQAKSMVDFTMINETAMMDRAMKELKQYAQSELTEKTGGGFENQSFQSLANDIRKFATDFIESKFPPSVKKWFVYYPAEVARISKFGRDESELINYLLREYFVRTSSPKDPYVLNHPHKEDHSGGIVLKYTNIFNNKKSGSFIECGAGDGENTSSTLYLERRLQWSGILVEADPDNFASLIKKQRKSNLVPACITAKDKPEFGKFTASPKGYLRVSDSTHLDNKTGIYVLCFPLKTIYLALGKKEVDLLVLNIGSGVEEEIIKTQPWKDINISVISIVYPSGMNVTELKKHMSQFNYNATGDETGGPLIFVKNDFNV